MAVSTSKLLQGLPAVQHRLDALDPEFTYIEGGA